MKIVFFILLVGCSATVAAQQDPDFMVSMAHGWQFDPGDGWTLDRNADLSLGYRIWPHGLLLVYVDYNRFSYDQYTYVAYCRKFSVLAGTKSSLVVPDKHVTPYFEGALGYANITSSVDTVRQTVGTMGSRNTYKVSSGNTLSFLAAFGVDIGVCRSVFVLLELRTTFGLNTKLYDLLIQYRTGIGFLF